ncbi:MAG: S8 family peptidase [Magnetococcales bacterium]|nr:S8 family peptidase [Magnetococcales bacterium]
MLPIEDDQTTWWEVWLLRLEHGEDTLGEFLKHAKETGLETNGQTLQFPDRFVLLVKSSKRLLTNSLPKFNTIAELRCPKESAHFFMNDLKSGEQAEWVDDLLKRTHYRATENSPHIAILDTGVNREHPLLKNALTSQDLHGIHQPGDVADKDGHGTEMAGLALWGDLADPLAGTIPIAIRHRLESVKILSKDNANQDPTLYGLLTMEAVSRPEITHPQRSRVFSMAVTADDDRDHGKPSSWSSTLDSLASDSDYYGKNPRLMIVSAGNVNIEDWPYYPAINSRRGIHDPGQAWNILTVGAYTEKTNIVERGGPYRPVASAGALSPFSTTSATWERPWPLKPDILFEGGNIGKDAYHTLTFDSLSLLTTHHEPHRHLLSLSNMTSAATALAARMAAQLMAQYPHFWPETIRGLMIHSAEWTEVMKQMYKQGNLKGDYENLIRHCGYGVPNLDRARWSASNALTMIAQDELKPFKQGPSSIVYNEMNYYKLPWPHQELQQLGPTLVEMRVTLSYFIEPNPAQGNYVSRYSYCSHGLRFDVIRPGESERQFRARINKLAKEEEEDNITTAPDAGWQIGPKLRSLGSIHSDRWQGTAADLASLGVIAVYPVSGWWKNRKVPGKFDSMARYTLLVSIHAPELELDLYNVVKNQITTQIAV